MIQDLYLPETRLLFRHLKFTATVVHVWMLSLWHPLNHSSTLVAEKAMWGAVPRRRRSGCVVHHVPVSEGFHIMNVLKPDFQLGPPHKKRCGIQVCCP